MIAFTSTLDYSKPFYHLTNEFLISRIIELCEESITCAPVAFRLDITCVPVALLIVPILTAYVTAVACPYRELSGRVYMQIQEHEDVLSTLENSSRGAQLRKFCCVGTHFQAFRNLSDVLFLRCFSEARKKHFRRNERKCWLWPLVCMRMCSTRAQEQGTEDLGKKP